MASFFQRLRSFWQKPGPSSSIGVQERETVPPAPLPATSVATPVTPEPVRGEAQFVNEELIYTVLRSCHDPEIPLNIVDLGLIYDVRIADEQVDVKMTLTTQGCGMAGYITREAEEKILALPGVSSANIEIVWEPPWTPEMISREGRKTLGLPE